MFVDGFIDGHPEQWEKLVDEEGLTNARNILKKGFKNLDPIR